MKTIKSLLIIFSIFIVQCLTAQVQEKINDIHITLDAPGSIDAKSFQTKTKSPSAQPDTTWNGVLTSSNLPIIVINTNNVTIPDTPKIAAQMGIIYNGEGVRNYMTDPFNNYNNKIGIELRGSTSQGFPQKQYSIETRDVNGLEHDTVVLGMPEENSWILYAPYDDKTCMRNAMTYDFANKIGHYAVRTKFCELVLNGQYMGIYVWMEKIKRDANRVDIAKLTTADTIGDQLTGGYIIKIDKPTGEGGTTGWNSNYMATSTKYIHFLYQYPDPADILIQQKNYIKAYVDSFEVALKATNFTNPTSGYRKYMSVTSFIDYFIMNEVSRNVDGYRLSTFLYKDKYSNGGKLHIGPVWDYNIAWWNANYCSGSSTTGWAYNFNSVCTDNYMVPFWWARLMQDTTFKSNLKCRWTELRQTVLSIPSIFSYIDSTVSLLNEAQVRHFTKWPILGVYTWPNPNPIPTSYPGEITAMKTWIQNRITWLDANMPGSYSLPVVNLGNDTTVCPGHLILNAGNTGSSFSWNNGATSQTITANNAGNYAVTVNRNGCKKTDTIAISLLPVPNVFAGNDTNICQGSNVALIASGGIGGISFVWNNNILQGVPFYPIMNQYYTVTATGINGCTNKDSVKVNVVIVPPKPAITAIHGIADTLISNSVSGNQWYKNGVLLAGEINQKMIVTSAMNGNYTVVVTVNGCSSDASDGVNTTVGVVELADNFSFLVFPNPFKNQTSITYNLKSSAYVRIVISDITGREIKVLTDSQTEKGEHTVIFDAELLRTGVYLYHIKAVKNTYTGKIIKLN